MQFKIYGLDIHYPFRDEDIRKVVEKENHLEKKFRTFGWNASRTLEEIQIMAKPFYLELEKRKGRLAVDEFIRLCTVEHRECLLRPIEKKSLIAILREPKNFILGYAIAVPSVLGSLITLTNVIFRNI